MGTVCARSKVSSSSPLVTVSVELRLGIGAGAEELLLRLRAGGEILPEDDGGDAGRAVCMAMRKEVEFLMVEFPPVDNGDEVRRRKVDISEGEGGESALFDPPDGVREWETVTGLGTVSLTERAIAPDTARGLVGGEEEENLRGDDGLSNELLGDLAGDPGRFEGSIWDADVA